MELSGVIIIIAICNFLGTYVDDKSWRQYNGRISGDPEYVDVRQLRSLLESCIYHTGHC